MSFPSFFGFYRSRCRAGALRTLSLVVLPLLALTGLQTSSVVAQESPSLRVLSSNGVRAPIESMLATLEQTLELRLDIEFSTAAALARRIEDGEAFDLAILTPALIDRLIAAESIHADSRTDFARTGVGVGARPGMSTAALGSSEDLKQLLLAADSVAFTAEGQSRATIDAAFERLGISEAMRDKSLMLGPGEAPGAVVAGQAELVLTLISEIAPVEGLELLGPFPAELQRYVTFTAGIGAGATDSRAARALLTSLQSRAMIAALEAQGLEAISN